jgi:hypothetical protein
MLDDQATDKTCLDEAMLSDGEVDSSDEVMLPGCRDVDRTTKRGTEVAYYAGSAGSKFASISVARDMIVDKPAEMTKLNTLESQTQEKLKAFDAKLKAGSRLSVSTGQVKAGDKRPTTTRNARGAQ